MQYVLLNHSATNTHTVHFPVCVIGMYGLILYYVLLQENSGTK